MVQRTLELSGLRLGDSDVFSISFIGPRTMRRINRDFLGHDYLTDVMAFDYRGDCRPNSGDTVAEVLICPDAAVRRCRETPGMELADELALYIVHGILHISGEDDLDPEPRAEMREKEKRLLRELGGDFDFKSIFPDSLPEDDGKAEKKKD